MMNESSIIYGLASIIRNTGPFRGRGYIAHRLFSKRFKKYCEDQNHTPHEWKVPLIDGTTIYAPDTSSQTWVALFTGDYGCKIVKWLSQFIDDDSIILDIGACFGFYAIPLLEQKKTCKLIAFEPFPGNLMYLKKNIEKNNLSERVLIKEFALGNEEKTLRMSTAEMGLGNAFIVEEEVPNFAMGLHEVKVKRLDSLDFSSFINNKKCSFIKVDCEGFDLNTLKGGSAFINYHRPIIFGEFSVYWMNHYKQDPNKDMHDWAESNKYQIYEMQTFKDSKLFDTRSFKLNHLLPEHSRSGSSLVLVPNEKTSRVS